MDKITMVVTPNFGEPWSATFPAEVDENGFRVVGPELFDKMQPLLQVNGSTFKLEFR